MRMLGCWVFLRFCCAARGATVTVAARTTAPLRSARRDINGFLLFISKPPHRRAPVLELPPDYSLEPRSAAQCRARPVLQLAASDAVSFEYRAIDFDAQPRSRRDLDPAMHLLDRLGDQVLAERMR